MKETINEVVLQGSVAYKFSTSEATVLTLIVNGATNVSNYPRVVCFGEAKKQADEFEKGDFVKVTGNIQSSKRKPKIKNQSLESVFAESVEKAKTVMEETFEVDGHYVSYKNDFKIGGEVTATECLTGNIYNITVKTTKNNRLSFVRLTKFVKSTDDAVLSIAPGDYVYVLGHIQTRKKTDNGVSQYFQNYIISEVKKA
jgi:single-stranded DNA-binding protein